MTQIDWQSMEEIPQNENIKHCLFDMGNGVWCTGELAGCDDYLDGES